MRYWVASPGLEGGQVAALRLYACSGCIILFYRGLAHHSNELLVIAFFANFLERRKSEVQLRRRPYFLIGNWVNKPRRDAPDFLRSPSGRRRNHERGRSLGHPTLRLSGGRKDARRSLFRYRGCPPGGCLRRMARRSRPRPLCSTTAATLSLGERTPVASCHPGVRSALQEPIPPRSNKLPRRCDRGSEFGFPEARGTPAASRSRLGPRSAGPRTNRRPP